MCFLWRKTCPPSFYEAIIVFFLCSRFLAACFMYTTSLRDSAPHCSGILSRNPSALVFWSCVYLTPSCQVTWALINVNIRIYSQEESRKLPSVGTFSSLLFPVNLALHKPTHHFFICSRSEKPSWFHFSLQSASSSSVMSTFMCFFLFLFGSL